MTRLSVILNSLLVKKVEGFSDFKVKGITYNSRKVKPGYIFACLSGTRAHGSEFISHAVSRGAGAVLTDRKDTEEVEGAVKIIVPEVREAMAVISSKYYGFPSTKLRLIGITGTNGKTTTAHLIDTLLSEAGKKTGLIGTVKYKLGEKTLPVLATTPESPDLQDIFFYMLKEGVSHVSMEVSSHALDLKRVSGCDFDIGVLTNISDDHLDFHQTFDRYLRAKGKLFSWLGALPEKEGRPKIAVINRDDRNFKYISDQVGVQKITYGIKHEADVMARNIVIKDIGVSFYVESPWGEGDINLKLTGLFSVYNALAALTVAFIEGLSWETSKKILEKITGVPGRFEKIEMGQDFTVVVDYAHTPDGLDNVLRTIKEFAEKRVITVFGCGGDRDRAKRVPMGEVAGKLSDYCFLTTDNPRTESSRQIFQDVEPGLLTNKKIEEFEICQDRRKAISKAIHMAEAGDVVLIAGKGHENYQIFKDRTITFDDREVAREMLKKKLQK